VNVLTSVGVLRLCAVGIALVLLAASCGGSVEERGGKSGGRTITGHGLSIELPDGWDGRAFKGEPSAASQIIAANFALPTDEYYLGPETARVMHGEGIYVGASVGPISEHLQKGRWVSASLPITVSRSDFADFEGVYSPAEAVRWLLIDGHAVLIMVGFGAEHPSDTTLATANAVLASFRMTPAG
jgi:hypothetical protein